LPATWVGALTSFQAAAVFVGCATYDAIALVGRYPGPDERLLAEEITYAGGGPAATAAVAAARLGLPVAFVGAVGDDAEGEKILDGLRAENVNVEAVQVVRGRQSGASVVVVDRNRGTRAICTRPVPPLDLPASGPGPEIIQRADWLHVDHLGWPAVSRHWAAVSDGRRPRLSVDAGNPIPGFTPRGVDLYVPTVQALIHRHGNRPIDELLSIALAEGARAVVATAGSQGTAAATEDGDRFQIPVYPVEVLSTVGAGDVFHGALVAELARGRPLRDGVRFASVAAALSCTGLDGRSAIPDRDAIQAALAVPAAAESA
jgi:sulfofructose kinase